jgi:transcriptional regulator with XRE-family HTH domain
MKVKTDELRKLLKRKGMSIADLARAMGVSAAEVEKMLNGEAVGVNTARKFIRYFTADEAQALIDWDAIGKKNPLACEADDDEDGEVDGDEAAEREYRELNYDPNVGGVEDLVDLEDKYRE